MHLFCCCAAQKSIFHLLRDQQQLLNKVKAVTGDITLPGLGLATSSKCMLEQQTDIILHCAADIRLEVDIHSALTANYCGTEAVLQLAAGCERVRALVHISSCFVNMNQPRSSVIDEQLYPLKFGETPVDCQALVQVTAVCSKCWVSCMRILAPWHGHAKESHTCCASSEATMPLPSASSHLASWLVCCHQHI